MKAARAALFVVLALLAATLAAQAQPAGRSYRVGFLALLPAEDATLMKPLLARLHELGYREGENLIFEYRSAEGHAERLAQLAADLVGTRPDVLITGFGTVAAKAAKTATASIPIVFTTVGDPVGAGLVTSLGRPGANVTGLTDQASELGGKRLELLREITTGKTSFGVLTNPDTPYSQLAIAEIRAAAAARQIGITVLAARTAGEFPARFADATDSAIAGLIVLEDPLTLSIRSRIVDLAATRRLPAIYQTRAWAAAGGLMSYGPDQRQIYRRAAEYADKILKGAKPADLPVEQPTKFEFVINQKTAGAIGLMIPPSLFARADDVIE